MNAKQIREDEALQERDRAKMKINADYEKKISGPCFKTTKKSLGRSPLKRAREAEDRSYGDRLADGFSHVE